MATAREYLVSKLDAASKANKWKVINTQRTLDQIDKVSIVVKQSEFHPVAEAPMVPGAFLVDFTVTVISPREDWHLAELELDDQNLALAYALRKSDNVRWLSSKKVVAGPNDRYLAYDHTIQILDHQGVTA